MKMRRILSVGALVLGLTVPTVSQAQFFWNFSTTDGTKIISGKFSTDGTYNDTLGTGTHVFTVTSIDAIFLDGANQTGLFGSGDPTVPQAANDSFTWSRDSQSFTAIESNSIFADEVGGTANSLIAISAAGSTSGLIGYADQNVNPNITFTATATTLTAVPEPQEYAIAALLAMGVFVTYRRRSAQALNAIA